MWVVRIYHVKGHGGNDIRGRKRLTFVESAHDEATIVTTVSDTQVSVFELAGKGGKKQEGLAMQEVVQVAVWCRRLGEHGYSSTASWQGEAL